eukprot:TRINITY_DN11103_c0_g2_i4.p1 TRINITY_DN11103_c0_g2~~TRINITY_DN11103_c0_g2_i4.p1  ORF type:complete len:425 (-),score=73.69 TRINITY_DN11103_c0_g2_i4:231-1505(-)
MGNVVMMMGEYVEKLLTDLDYFQTRLPRIPVLHDREIQKKILIVKEKRERKQRNMEMIDQFVPGARVRAISAQDNEWHYAIVQRIEGKQVRVLFDENKADSDEGSFMMLKLLEEQFKGNRVFMGGDEELINFGNVELIVYQELQDQDAENGDNVNDEREMVAEYADERGGEGGDDDVGRDEREYSETDSRDRRKRRKNRRRSSSRSRSSSSRSASSHHSRRRHKGGNSRRRRRNSSRDRSSRSRSGSRHRRRERSSSRSRSSSRDRRRDDRKRATTGKDREVAKPMGQDRYIEEIIKRQRNEAVASSKSEYAKRPTSYKTSLSNPLPMGSSKRRSRSRSPVKKEVFIKQDRKDDRRDSPDRAAPQHISAEAYEKMRKLKEMYGDAATRPAGKVVNRSDSLYTSETLDEGPSVLRLGMNSNDYER